MEFKNTQDLLNLVVAGEELASSDIERIVKDFPDEDQLLEYKDGKILEKLKRSPGDTKKPEQNPAEIIREYLSAFANSDGGLLIIGVSEKVRTTGKRRITGGKAPGGEGLDKWAASCLVEMASFFSPPPRFQVVQHGEHDVLVCGVARAPQLVPCIVKLRRWKYFLRIHDNTVECPDFLISDLVLGRRNHPVFRLDIEGANRILREPHVSGTGTRRNSYSIQFRIENHSFVPVDSISIGLISWGLPDKERAATDFSRAYTDEQIPDKLELDGRDLAFPWSRFHQSVYQPLTELKTPFTPAFIKLSPALLLPALGGARPPIRTCAHAAVYILSTGSMPMWYQLTVQDSNYQDRAVWDLNRNVFDLKPTRLPLIAWKLGEHGEN